MYTATQDPPLGMTFEYLDLGKMLILRARGQICQELTQRFPIGLKQGIRVDYTSMSYRTNPIFPAINVLTLPTSSYQSRSVACAPDVLLFNSESEAQDYIQRLTLVFDELNGKAGELIADEHAACSYPILVNE